MPSGAGDLAILEGFLQEVVMWLVNLYQEPGQKITGLGLKRLGSDPAPCAHLGQTHPLRALCPVCTMGRWDQMAFLNISSKSAARSSLCQCLLNIFPCGKPGI